MIWLCEFMSCKCKVIKQGVLEIARTLLLLVALEMYQWDISVGIQSDLL